MKPLMLISIVLLTAIILASSFGLHIMSIDPIYSLGAEYAGRVLYVCPMANQIWDPIAAEFFPYIRYINMAFLFAVMILIFSWGWALYQNLLNDKFEKKAFDNPWMITKVVFWIGVVILLLVWTPNNYRSVQVVGAPGNWILCEENIPGALPVLESAVKR